jgi:predicted TIM-barrel fold metal-dependent hydrolase
MIRIDTHLHVMMQPFFGRPPTDPHKLLDDLMACGIEGGWVSSVDALTTRDLDVQRRANDALAEMAQGSGGRLQGFCTVDPGGMDASAREVERSIQELGLIGVKLHPWLQAFSLTHAGMAPIMEVAGDLGVPVMFHDGTPPYSTSCQAAWLAERYPRTQVILGHAGLADLWRDAADAAQRLTNIWLQPAGSPPITIRMALQGAGRDRLLFGSDGGFASIGVMRYVIAKYHSAVGQQVTDQAMTHNPERVMAYRTGKR